MADTGNTTSISFATTSFTADIVSISGLEVTKDAIEITNLSHTGHKRFIVDDLAEMGDITITAYSDCKVPDIAYDYGSYLDEVITITYPVPPTGTTGGTVVFAGRPISVKASDAEMGEIMAVEMVIKATGNRQGFAFTPGS